MKLKSKLFVIPLTALVSSCSNRNFEAFEDFDKNQVKEICEAYSNRVYGSKKEASFVFMYKNLGLFKNKTVYVNILKYEKNGVGFSDAEVDVYLISETLPKTYFNR